MLCGDARMVWMPMPGQTWAGAAAAFLAMWMAMMVPMMLPSLAPALWRCRARPAAVAAVGYYFVWALIGLAVYPLGVLLAGTGSSRLSAAIVLGAGLVQFSEWKRKHLACCRAFTECGAASPADAPAAWLHGMHLGTRCALCCGNLMAVLLAIGATELTAMIAVTAAIALERLAPAGTRVARATGVVVVGAGLLLLVRAL